MAIALPTKLIECGVVFAAAQNGEYALPSTLVFLHSTAAVETSIDGTNWTALTGGSTTGVVTADPFVRCTGGACSIIVKKY
jgi:hypothetical protein